MRIIPSNYKKSSDLPLKLKVSFEAVFNYLEDVASKKEHYLHKTAQNILKDFEHLHILKEGFEDLKNLNKYNREIDKLLDVLFPEPLENNVIKAASIPFEFTTFKLSKRFEKILDEAGENFELRLRNFDESNMYILSCTFILAFYYKVNIDFRRPFYFDIPNKKMGIIRNYRTLFNGDFFKIKALENAIPISNDDIKVLLDNFNNIDVWKEKFPPNSYEFKGFGIVNLFDVTQDQSLVNLKENLLRKDENSFEDLELSIAKLFESKTIKFGYSNFIVNNNNEIIKTSISKNSYLVSGLENGTVEGFFCKGITNKVFQNNNLLAISDIDRYGETTNYNGLYQVLKKQKIESIILVPLKISDDKFGIMELVSPKKYELNSINANKLLDVIPAFAVTVKRFMDEYDTKLESIIQENYTSIHPTVKWKFYEEAENFLFNQENNPSQPNKLKSIAFENVIPLYGQCDIKGSSVVRNNAIQADLIKQLELAKEIMSKASKRFEMPIYGDLQYRIDRNIKNLKKGVNSGDEINLTNFLSEEIYPVFNHLKTLDQSLAKEIDFYLTEIDDKIHVIYDERKKYEESVTTLNEELAKFIDKKQIEAQKMFPHYFERFKTDGIDYNIYIGQSLVNNLTYNEVYLHNLRLWQLQLTCELESLAHSLNNKLQTPLQVASLILVQSSPLAIKFRMDEKHFDVDGAYNIRYEILKKRIDKAKIANTNERLTQPTKIAIVYTQSKDATEYIKYIKFLQAKNYLLPKIEKLDIEDVQGVSGLKALRVEVNYNISEENKRSIKQLLGELNITN